MSKIQTSMRWTAISITTATVGLALLADYSTPSITSATDKRVETQALATPTFVLHQPKAIKEILTPHDRFATDALTLAARVERFIFLREMRRLMQEGVLSLLDTLDEVPGRKTFFTLSVKLIIEATCDPDGSWQLGWRMNREHSPWSYVGWSAKSGGEFGIIAGKTAQLFEAPLGSLLNAPLRLDAARDGSPRWSIQLVEDLRRAVALTFGGQPFDNSALADTIGCHIVGIQTLAYVPMPITPSDSASDLLDPERHNNFHEGSIPLKTDTPLLFHIIHHLLDGDEWMSDLGYRAGMWLYLNGNNRTHVNYLYDAPEVGLIQISNNSGVGVRIELAPDHVTLRIFSEHGSYIETFPNPNGLYWFEWVHPSPPHTQRPVGLVILHHEVFARIPEIYRRVTVAGICDVEFSPEDEYTESQLDNFRNGRPNTDSASPKAKRPSRKGSRRSKPQSRALARAL